MAFRWARIGTYRQPRRNSRYAFFFPNSSTNSLPISLTNWAPRSYTSLAPPGTNLRVTPTAKSGVGVDLCNLGPTYCLPVVNRYKLIIRQCYCGHGGMKVSVDPCPRCGVQRCPNCETQRFNTRYEYITRFGIEGEREVERHNHEQQDNQGTPLTRSMTVDLPTQIEDANSTSLTAMLSN